MGDENNGLQVRQETLKIGDTIPIRGSEIVAVMHLAKVTVTLARNPNGKFEIMKFTGQSMKFNESTGSWYDMTAVWAEEKFMSVCSIQAAGAIQERPNGGE